MNYIELFLWFYKLEWFSLSTSSRISEMLLAFLVDIFCVSDKIISEIVKRFSDDPVLLLLW